MTNFIFTSLSLAISSIALYLNFLDKSNTIKKQRDAFINKAMNDFLSKNAGCSFSVLINHVLDKTGSRSLKFILSNVEPSGFRKAIIWSAVALTISGIYSLLEYFLTGEWHNYMLKAMNPAKYLWTGTMAVSLFFLIDDARYYSTIMKMNKTNEDT